MVGLVLRCDGISFLIYTGGWLALLEWRQHHRRVLHPPVIVLRFVYSSTCAADRYNTVHRSVSIMVGICPIKAHSGQGPSGAV